MPDITMCRDHECPSRNECLRFMALPDGWSQSYFVGSPRTNEHCDYFWPIRISVQEGIVDE